MYYIAANPEESSLDVENRYVEVLQSLRQAVQIPIAMKLSSQFSAPIPFARRLTDAGANGLAIFNRFYQPDIDLDTFNTVPTLEMSSSTEALLRIRWAALLYGRIEPLSLAVTGGFHTRDDLLKALLAGADVVHLCSELLQRGPTRITDLLQEMRQWLEEHEYESVAQLKGSVSYQHAVNPGAYERANYLQVLESYGQPIDIEIL